MLTYCLPQATRSGLSQLDGNHLVDGNRSLQSDRQGLRKQPGRQPERRENSVHGSAGWVGRIYACATGLSDETWTEKTKWPRPAADVTNQRIPIVGGK